MDLLEHARDRREVRGLRRADVLHQPARVAAPEGQRAAGLDRDHLDHPRERVRERQEHEQGGGRPQVGPLDVRVAGEQDVAVGQHAALGRTGGAGRVDDGGDVIGADGVEPALQLGLLDLAGAGSHVGDRGGVAGRLHAHDVLEAGQLAAHRLDLLELRRVLDDDRAGAGVVDHVAALLGRVRVVDRHDDDAGGQQGGVGQRPFRARLAQQRHAVAGLEAERDEAAGQLADRVAELRERPLVPRPVAREADRGAAVALGGVQHHPAQGVRAHTGDADTGREVVTPEPRRFSRRRAPWPEGSCRARRCSSARARAPPRPDRPRSRARPRRCARRSTSRRGTGGRCPPP